MSRKAFCCEISRGLNKPRGTFELSSKFRKLTERTESGRELTFADHVGDFDCVQRRSCLSECSEPQHRSNAPLYETVILLDDIV